MRMLTKGSALLLSLFPGITWSLVLGDIEVDTVLNQPLRAEIGLLSIAPDEVEDVRVKLAPPAAFDRAGLTRPYVLNQLEFKPTVKDGVPTITVSTKTPLREPFLNFLIEVVWPKGRLVQEYTVLLDTPVFQQRQAPAAAQAPAVAPPTAAQRPAQAAAPAQPAKPAALTPPGSAPQVHSGDKPLRAIAADQAAAQELQSLDQGVAATRYEVMRDDTLFEIAREHTVDTDVSVEQFMVAVLRANPTAFTDENMNNLKSGHVLRLPNDDETNAITEQEALAEVSRQYALWRGNRAALAGTAVLPQETAVAVEQETQRGPDEQLKILAADRSGDAQPETLLGGGDSVAELHKQIALAQELAESRQQENQELQARVRELEDMVSQQERIISLQSDELAELQQRLLGETMEPVISEHNVEAGEEGVGATAHSEVATEATEQGSVEQVRETADKGESTLAESTVKEAQQAPTAAEPENDSSWLTNPVWLFALGGTGLLLLAAGSKLRTPGRGKPIANEVAEAADRVQAEPVAEQAPMEEAAGADSDDDVLTEADVYITYGFHQRAAELLKDALAREPKRNEYRVKLLEAHHGANDKDAFDELAQALHASGAASDELWSRVAAMGRELSPENPLFQDADVSGVSVGELASKRPEMTDIDLSGAEPLKEELDLGKDFKGAPTEEVPNADEGDLLDVHPADRDMEVQPRSVELHGLKADSGEDDTQIEDTVASDDFATDRARDESGTAAEPTDTVVEHAPAALLPERHEKAGAQRVDSTERIEISIEISEQDAAAMLDYLLADDGELADLGSTEINNVKLDLAKVYIDMGDADGARSRLEEVMRQGNSDQRKEAKELIKQIA